MIAHRSLSKILYAKGLADTLAGVPSTDLRMHESVDSFEFAFEQEAALERGRRAQLRRRAADRSRARTIQTTQKRGNVSFGVLLVALAFTVVVVTVVMFETLAWLMA